MIGTHWKRVPGPPARSRTQYDTRVGVLPFHTPGCAHCVSFFFFFFFFYWAFAGFSPSSAWKSQKEKEKPNDIDDARKEIALKLDGDGQNRRRRATRSATNDTGRRRMDIDGSIE